MIINSASWVLDTGCGAHVCNNLQVLERSKKLSKDEMILRLGDGKAVAAKTIGSLRLVVSDHIRIDLKDYFYVTNVCGPLKTPARGGFSYFITFIDDHSWYGYVYLMRYKCEAFGRFKKTDLKLRIKLTTRSKLFGRTEVRIADGMRSCLRNQAKNLDLTAQHHLSLRLSLMVFQCFVDQPENLEYLRAFKARLVAKGYTQRPGVDFEETHSPVAMAKSTRILLSIATSSIYGLKQASRSWKTHFDEVIQGYDLSRTSMILVYTRRSVGAQLHTLCFMSMTSYSLGMMLRDRSRRMLGLTQSSYIEKVLKRFKMENSKRGFLSMRDGIKLSKKQSPKNDEELKRMSDIPYASAIGSIQYVV
ncbi:UNVERIFIED_CONTAM: Retrovirus-related Pol polyprotein from transposon RE1 [Sesamum latifolium]|uniref:Retrovirus-related Pol polyprotein from transposon RE1 n=1 Tax=Sesamum latifolium TaxID=2727402 RepID=A0AAW2WV83_9LAMI